MAPLPGGLSGNRLFRSALLALLACGALFAFGASTASAGTVTIVNDGSNGETQKNWLESWAIGGTADPGDVERIRVAMLVKHDVGDSIDGVKIDEDWNTSDNIGSGTTIHSVTQERPSVSGGYGYTKIEFTKLISTSGTGHGCTSPRLVTDKFFRIKVRTDDGDESSTSSSRIKFTDANDNCCTEVFGVCVSGTQDYPHLYAWGASNFNREITPGTSLDLVWRGDDRDVDVLTSDDEIGGVRWRRRNVMTGATSGTTAHCTGPSDAADKTTTVPFPDKGRYVVEAELLDEDCNTTSGGHWWPLGSADVNQSAAPTLDLTTTPSDGRAHTNANVTINAAIADSGGAPEYLEWDTDNDGSFDDEIDRGTHSGSNSPTLSSPQTAVINTTGMTPGDKTVRARVTDNGAMGAADNVRKTSSIETITYKVNSLPVATGVPDAGDTIGTESHLAKAFTLTGTDGDSDPLTFDIIDNPDHGTICTTSSGGCTEGTGANRFYRPNGTFAGADTFTVRAIDDHSGQSTGTATVTVNVTPNTSISSAPDAVSGSASASFSFNTPVTGSPAVTFECRIDSTQETDFAPCTSPRLYSGLSDGSHTFHVRAKRSTFVDPTPAAHTWTLDSTAPDTFINTQPADPTSSSTANFTFNSNDPSATFQCRRDGDAPTGTGWVTCTSPRQYTTLAEGSHTFEVRATDQFNRTDPIPASYTWDVDLTAPTVSIDSTPADPTNQTTADFGFSSPDNTATFQCKLDTGGFSSCASPKSYAGLDQGPHTFTVRATDPASNTGPEQSFTWEIDTTVPDTFIDDGPPPSTATDAASFLFSSDDGGAGFECRVDSTDPGDWEECSPPQLYADLGDGDHAIEVRATDAAGNKDATPATQSWTIDTTAPQTTIDSSPLNPSGSADAEFAFSSPDLTAVFECRFDAEAGWTPCNSAAQHLGLGDGTHVFRVRAKDALDNTDPTPATRTWTVDTTGPGTTIEGGPSNPTGSDGGAVSFSADEPGSTFECRLDSDEELEFQACNSPTPLSSLDDGDHDLDVRATDVLGNTGGVTTHSWTVDTTPPDVQITTGMPATTSSAAASFEFTSTDGGAEFQCRIDGGGWHACVSPRNYGGLDEGSHSFDVRARDSVGNTGAPTSDSWSVENSGPPSTQIDSAPPATTGQTSASFDFSASEPSDFQCRLDAAAFTACGSGTSGDEDYAGLTPGSHTFQVRATDLDGNADQTPASHTWSVTAPPAPSGGVAGTTAQSPLITAGTRPLKRGRGIAATISCPTGPCTVSRKKAKLKVGGTTFRARVKAPSSLSEGSTTQVKIKLTGIARAALAAAGGGRLTLNLTVGSAGGTVSKKIKLKVKP